MAQWEKQLLERKNNLKILKYLRKKYPKTFFHWGRSCQPLKIGIFNEVLEQSPEIPKRELHQFFRAYCHRSSYRSALATKKYRIDLSGRKSGLITDDERQHVAPALMEKAA